MYDTWVLVGLIVSPGSILGTTKAFMEVSTVASQSTRSNLARSQKCSSNCVFIKAAINPPPRKVESLPPTTSHGREHKHQEIPRFGISKLKLVFAMDIKAEAFLVFPFSSTEDSFVFGLKCLLELQKHFT